MTYKQEKDQEKIDYDASYKPPQPGKIDNGVHFRSLTEYRGIKDSVWREYEMISFLV